jgi:hypothetical protein
MPCALNVEEVTGRASRTPSRAAIRDLAAGPRIEEAAAPRRILSRLTLVKGRSSNLELHTVGSVGRTREGAAVPAVVRHTENATRKCVISGDNHCGVHRVGTSILAGDHHEGKKHRTDHEDCVSKAKKQSAEKLKPQSCSGPVGIDRFTRAAQVLADEQRSEFI